MTTTFTFADGFLNLEHCRKMEPGGGESGDESGTWRRMDSLNLEVSVTARDLKLILGRLGDLEDPYFKCLEVILLSSRYSGVDDVELSDLHISSSG